MGHSNNTKNPFNDIPPYVIDVIHQFLLGVHDTKLDPKQAHIRPSIVKCYPFIIFMYSILIVTGVLSNMAVLSHIARHRLCKDPTYTFLINNVVSDIVKCVCVLPISLYVLLIQNWMLGELLCSFLPMLQDIPLHTSTLTFVIMAWDRFRYVRHPNKIRLPAFVCAIGAWLTALCLVLPYPIYIIYVDLGKYMSAFEGVGICIVNLTDDMQEYMRGIFLVMYAAPLATISYLYVKVSRELQTQQSNMSVILYETRREGRSRADSHSTNVDIRSTRGENDGISQHSRASHRDSRNSYRDSRLYHDNDIDVPKEKRTQKYLVSMVTMYAICLCPLMVLRLARLALLETYDNSAHFDITYTIFVWIAFLPTCSTPLLFASWQMSRSAKERLRGYFRFSNRKLRQSCETVVTAAGTPAAPRALCNRGDALTHSVNEGHSDNSSFQQDFSPS